MYKNSALLSIGAALVFSLFFLGVGHAFQIVKGQEASFVIAGDMKGTANLSTTQVSTMPNPCTVGGKGRTGAPGTTRCLSGSGEKASDTRIVMASEMNSWTGVPSPAVVILFITGLIALAGLSLRGLRHHHGHHA